MSAHQVVMVTEEGVETEGTKSESKNLKNKLTPGFGFDHVSKPGLGPSSDDSVGMTPNNNEFPMRYGLHRASGHH